MSGFAKAVCYSAQWQDLLQKECRRRKIPYHKPERCVASRWNSTAEMLASALSLQPAISAITKKEPLLHKYHLSDVEWTIANQLQPILKVM